MDAAKALLAVGASVRDAGGGRAWRCVLTSAFCFGGDAAGGRGWGAQEGRPVAGTAAASCKPLASCRCVTPSLIACPIPSHPTTTAADRLAMLRLLLQHDAGGLSSPDYLGRPPLAHLLESALSDLAMNAVRGRPSLQQSVCRRQLAASCSDECAASTCARPPGCITARP